MPGLSRRGFLKSSTLVLGSLATQHFLSKTGLNLALAQITVNRPFRMLTLGDSVVWGQGLLEEHKFSNQVKRWLEQDKAIAGVDLKVMAHSGATITVGNNLDTDRKWQCMDGEINRANPTIMKQVSLAAEDYCSQNIPLEDVDLILLNGGINDVDKLTIFGGIEVTKLKTPKVLKVTASVEKIKKLAGTYCDMEMRKLLVYVASTFPNARIVLTGYFPIITCATPRWAVAHLVMEALGLPVSSEKLISMVERNIPESDEVPTDYCQDNDLGPLHRRLARLSEAWRSEANAALCRAAKWINNNRPWMSRVNSSSPCVVPPKPRDNMDVGDATFELCTDPLLTGEPISRNRVFFARPEFRKEHGYGADSSYLWRLISNPNNEPVPCTSGLLKTIQGLVINEDDLRGKRPCWCCEASGKYKNNLTCIRAGAFHPNVNGAAAYKTAIVEQLDKVYADTGWGDVQWGPAPSPSPAHATTGERCTQLPCRN